MPTALAPRPCIPGMTLVHVCRSKQTQEEAVKLKRIQKELQALDDMVSSDISILRDRIEEASWDYSAARYVRESVQTDSSNLSGPQSDQWGPDWDLWKD